MGLGFRGIRLRPWPRAATFLVIGLLIREAFSFWTGHPYDFEVWIRTGYVVAHGTNPYIAFWPAAPGGSIDSFTGTLPSAAYLPFWPLVTGGSYQLYLAVGGGDRFVYYFFLKQVPIFADVATAFLLYRLVQNWTGDYTLATRALAFWCLFPYAIVITAVWGQFDSVEVLCLLAILLVAGTPRRNLAYGIGILVKWVTVIYLPFEFFRERGLRRLWILLGLAVPAALTVVVFLALRWPFTGIEATTTSEAGGGGGAMNYARLFELAPIYNAAVRVPGLLTLLPYLFVPVVFAVGWVMAKRVRTAGGPRAELTCLLAIMGAFLLTRWGLNEQYFLYLFAPMALDIYVFHPGRRDLYTYIGTLASAFLIVNNTFGIWFLTPLNVGYDTWAINFNRHALSSPIREYTLDGLAILITLSLVQLVWALLQDQPHPRPWLLRILPGWTPSRPPSPEPPGA